MRCNNAEIRKVGAALFPVAQLRACSLTALWLTACRRLAGRSDWRLVGPNLDVMTPDSTDVERWSALKVWLFSLFHRTPKSNLPAVQLMSLSSGDRFVDLGCGLGAALEHAAATGAETAGIDPSTAMVERAARRVPGADVRLGSAEIIPFEDDRFTAALAVSTFHHWADHEAGLAEVRRVLSPGGRLLIVEKKLRGGDGHGMDSVGADRLSQMLVSHGYASPEVRTMRVGRADYLTVSAVNPVTH
jgi:SAM-dependent methyltransferase